MTTTSTKRRIKDGVVLGQTIRHYDKDGNLLAEYGPIEEADITVVPEDTIWEGEDPFSGL